VHGSGSNARRNEKSIIGQEGTPSQKQVADHAFFLLKINKKLLQPTNIVKMLDRSFVTHNQGMKRCRRQRNAPRATAHGSLLEFSGPTGNESGRGAMRVRTADLRACSAQGARALAG